MPGGPVHFFCSGDYNSVKKSFKESEISERKSVQQAVLLKLLNSNKNFKVEISNHFYICNTFMGLGL
jgi:hypothetical protein